MNCCLCRKRIKPKGRWKKGHNAWPLKTGRCCEVCNTTKVLPARRKDADKFRIK